jgi:signal transduction histidine kinase
MSGQHLLAVIDNVLDVTRLNAGVLPLSCVDVPVANVLDDAVHMLQPPAAQKDQRLRAGRAGTLAVRADPNRLRQVLVNLIDNAIKYTPARGRIDLHVGATERAGHPFVGIAVTDNGPGIAADVSTTVFEPYQRGGGAAYEPGLGLGLYISRELVRQMGGDIELQSEPGQGSTFTAFLPMARD